MPDHSPNKTDDKGGGISPLSFLFLLVITLCPALSRAQIYDFKTYTIRDGLISNDITCLCQDSYGRLWIGTGDGVSVYDGESFRNYSIVDGLGAGLVNCIIEDTRRKGVMWIGTNGGGVVEFKAGEFSASRLGKSDWTNRVNSITQSKDGRVFCATDDGVYALRNGVSQVLPGPLRRGTFIQATARGDSLLILNASGSLFLYHVPNGEVERPPIAGVPIRIRRFAADTRNRLWAASFDGALVDMTTGRTARGVFTGPAKSLACGKYGRIWISTPDGLYGVDASGRHVHMTTANGLKANDVSSCIVDREGDVWIGTSGRGLEKLEDVNSFQLPVEFEKIPTNNSLAATDRRGHIWIAARSGLKEVWYGMSGRLRSFLHTYRSLRVIGSCSTLQVDSGDMLWLATDEGEVKSFRIERASREPSRLSARETLSVNSYLPGRGVLCLYVDPEGHGWYSRDLAGVLEFDARSDRFRPRVYTTADGLPDNSIRAIFRDREGNVWFGGYIGGLSKFSPVHRAGGMKKYTRANGLPDNSVRAITQDDSGRIWIGTRYGGVVVKAGSRFVPIGMREGLVSDGIWAICFDRNYGEFFGTQLGLQKLGRGNLFERSWSHYGESTPYYAVGTTKAPSGPELLWACSSYGIFITDMNALTHPNVQPVIRLSGMSVNGRRIHIDSLEGEGRKLILQYSQNNITFTFAGISLREEGLLQYRYFLRGVDNDWHALSRRLPVTYAALRPGKYTFEVKAVNAEALQSSSPAAVSFAIVPPYWRTWWFASSVAILLLAGVYFSVRMKVGRLLEIERVRSRIATDLHDDIGSGLTRIAILADVAMRKAAESGASPGYEQAADGPLSTQGILERIGLNARELVDSMSDVVWSMDPRNVTLGDLVTRFRSFAYEVCEAKEIRLEFHEDEEIESLRLDPAVMRTLLLVCKEALNNSIKHSGCSRVRIAIKHTGKRVKVEVTDDGVGLRPGKSSGGHGLDNMRNRARKLGGEFAIRSIPGDGTSINVSIPLEN